jgi:hypothetical protein
MEKSRKLGLDCPVSYEITVQGWLDESWSDWFEEATLAPELNKRGIRTTTLNVTVADQAALIGLLRKLYGLGLPLLSLSHVERGEEFN